MMEIEKLESKFEREITKTNEILSKVLVMVQNHESYVSDGKRWRTAVIGMAFTMLLQVGGGLYLAGQLSERMENNIKMTTRNEARLDRADAKFEAIIREGRAYYRNNEN